MYVRISLQYPEIRKIFGYLTFHYNVSLYIDFSTEYLIFNYLTFDVHKK